MHRARRPTHPLLGLDVKRARDTLEDDPCFQHDKPRQKPMEYLPQKLKATKGFLP